MIVIAIDPGKTGGICIMSTSPAGDCQSVRLFPTPLIGSSKKQDFSRQGMKNLVLLATHQNGITRAEKCLAVIEDTIAMPKQSAQSAKVTHAGMYLWEGIFVGMDIPYMVVRGQDWQKEIFRGMPRARGDTKSLSLLVAQRMFPAVSLVPPGKKVESDGLSDAICIAEWGRRVHFGRIPDPQNEGD